MAIEGTIQSAVKSDKAIIGYKESMKAMKSGGAKAVIVSNNIPEAMSAEIKHNATVGGAELEIFQGSSKDLGTACGKPFPVSVLVIKS